MNSFSKLFNSDIPNSLGHLFFRFLKIVVIGFVVLQVKEYIDAGRLDTAATLVDSALIAAGVLIVDFVSMRLKK